MSVPLATQVVLTILSLLAASLILTKAGSLPAGLAMAFLMTMLVRHYFRQFRAVFTPSTLVGRMRRHLQIEWAAKRDDALLKGTRGLSADSPDYAKKHFSQLEVLLFSIGLIRLFANRLKQWRENEPMLLFSLLLLLVTFILTIVTFGFEYYGLTQLGTHHFSQDGGDSVLFYLYHSFATFLTADTGDFHAVSGWAMLLTAAELVSMIVVGVLFVFIVTTVVRDRQREELNELILALDTEEAALIALIEREHNLSITNATVTVLDTKSDTIVKLFVDILKEDKDVNHMKKDAHNGEQEG